MYFLFLIILVILLFVKRPTKSQRFSGDFISPTSKGSYGEQLVVSRLRDIQGYKKILTNCYVPKNDGSTTEIDVILLHESGIYVFESKNYSGWIFGKESDQYWTQTLPVSRGVSNKSKFFNPVLQNKVHLKWLHEYLGSDYQYYSYIVFGDGCELKNVVVSSPLHRVIKSRDLYWCISNNIKAHGNILSSVEIDKLYDKLYPLTQVSAEQKQKHINDIQDKHHLKSDDIYLYPDKIDSSKSSSHSGTYTYVDAPVTDPVIIFDFAISECCDFFSKDPEFRKHVQLVEIKRTVQDD